MTPKSIIQPGIATLPGLPEPTGTDLAIARAARAMIAERTPTPEGPLPLFDELPALEQAELAQWAAFYAAAAARAGFHCLVIDSKTESKSGRQSV